MIHIEVSVTVDDDICYVVEAKDTGSADSKFKGRLSSDAKDTSTEIYIISSDTLKGAIEERIK